MINKKEKCRIFRKQLETARGYLADFNKATNLDSLGDYKDLIILINGFIEVIKADLVELADSIRKILKPSYLALDEFMLDVGYPNGAINTEIDVALKKIILKMDLVLGGGSQKTNEGTLPKNIIVKGNLKIEKFLLHISSGLVVDGDLDIIGDEMTVLPEDLIVHGNLSIPPQLLDQANKLKAKGNIKGRLFVTA